jgi:hypothetical protein
LTVRNSAKPQIANSQIQLSPKIIKRNILLRNTKIVKHVEHRGIHHGRSAEIILNLLGQLVPAQVIVKQNLVYESLVSCPVILGQRLGEGNIECKVGELLLQLTELILIEDLSLRAGTVPV